MTTQPPLALLALGRSLDALFLAYSELETADALAHDAPGLRTDLEQLLTGVRTQVELLIGAVHSHAPTRP